MYSVSNMDFLFDTDQARIDSVSYGLRITLRGEILEGLYPVLYIWKICF